MQDFELQEFNTQFRVTGRCFQTLNFPPSLAERQTVCSGDGADLNSNCPYSEYRQAITGHQTYRIIIPPVASSVVPVM